MKFMTRFSEVEYEPEHLLGFPERLIQPRMNTDEARITA
jgi:hypothetical protein